jgi:hypothetical protein
LEAEEFLAMAQQWMETFALERATEGLFESQ